MSPTRRPGALMVRDLWVYGIVFLGTTLLALTLEHPSLASDRGVFVSMASALGHGLTPYGAVFDHKDPLTFALGAALMLVLGGAGWFVADAALIGVTCVCVLAMARAMRLALVQQLLVVVVVGVVLLRAPALAGMAQTAGIAVLSAVCLSCVLRRPALCGALLGLLVLARLSLVPLGLAVFAIALVGATSRRRVRAVILTSTIVVLGFVVLGALGGIPGYIDMIQMNLGYRAKVAQVLNTPASPVPTLVAMQRGWVDGSSLLLLIAAAIGFVCAVALLLVRPGGLRAVAHRRPVVPVAVAVSGLGIAVLATTYLWTHHVQFIALPLALLIAVGFAPGNVLTRTVALRYGYVLLVVVAIGVYGFAIGSPYPRLAPSVGLTAWQTLDDSPTQRLVRIAAAERGTVGDVRLAVIGENNELGVLEALSGRVHLACRNFYQFPWMTREMLAQTASCVTSDANVVLVHPDPVLCRLDPECMAFRRSVDSALASAYVRRAVDGGSGWELWVRR